LEIAWEAGCHPRSSGTLAGLGLRVSVFGSGFRVPGSGSRLGNSLGGRVTSSLVRDAFGQRFRGGLIFKAHRLMYHSTLRLRVIKKTSEMAWEAGCHPRSSGKLSGCGSRFSDPVFRFRVSCSGIRVSESGFWVPGLASEIAWEAGCHPRSSGTRNDASFHAVRSSLNPVQGYLAHEKPHPP